MAIASFRKRNILVMIFLAIITLGIYYGVWCYQTNKVFAKKGKQAFPSTLPIILIFIFISTTVLRLMDISFESKEKVALNAFTSALYEEVKSDLHSQKIKVASEEAEVIKNKRNSLNTINKIVTVLQWLILLFCVFALANKFRNEPYDFQLKAPFLFIATIFYLQYHINRSIGQTDHTFNP